MLTGKQSAFVTGESGCSVETVPLRFIATNDGRTLLALTENEDGIIDIIATPITLTSSSSGPASLIKRMDGNVIVHPPVFQINMEDASYSEGGNSTNSWIQDGISLISTQTIQGIMPVVEPTFNDNVLHGQTLQPAIQQKEVIISEKPPSNCIQEAGHEENNKCKGSPGRPKKNEIRSTEGTETLKCNICQQQFSKQTLYRKHMENHAEEKPHRCPKCPASFNIPTNFTLHMATHNSGDPKCPECGRKFARMASLKSHILLHEKEENLFCTECEDAFSTKAQLDAHLKLHGEKWSNEEVRKCKLCNKQFTQPALYKLHIREHYRLQTRVAKQTKRGAKHKTMYKCTICLKSFQKPSQLMRHIRVHTGEKPFKCTICGRAFTQKSSLQIHTWQHNGIRPHTCDFCNAKFSQKGNLNAHILRVHNAPEGEPIHGCTYCSCVFKKFGSLNGHIKRMHSNINEENINKEDNTKTESDMRAAVHNVMSQLASLESASDGATTELRLEPTTGNDILQQALRNSGLSSKNKISEEGISEINKMEAQTNFVTLLDRTPDGSTRKYLTIRQRCIGNVRWYACSFCQKEFKKPSDLIRHLRVHTQEKPFKCTHCCRSFALKSTMIAHERTHSGTKKYICDSCNKTFACHGSLVAHTRLQHGKPDISEEKWASSNTEAMKYVKKAISKTKSKLSAEAKSLVTQVVLQEPLVITETENRISVAQVATKQKRAYELGASNDVARPHRCWVCHAAFRKVSHLKQHYRRHTGERPYKCSTCDRRFTSNSVLKSHLHTHEDLRPYSCSVCGTKFSTQSSMKRHLVTHSNKRPFMCPYCHKTFKTYVNCRKHMKIHKHELAQRQLEQQNTEEEKGVVSVLSENLNLTDSMNMSFQPEVGQDFPQNFPEQLECLSDDKDKPLIPTERVTSTIVNQSLHDASAASLEGPQMLNADETGTVTIPSYTNDQTLTPESIREIEETLNQQLFSIGMNLGLGNNLVRQIEEGNCSGRDQRVFNVIYENNKNSESSGNNVFTSQFDSFDMSQIGLQASAGIDLGLVDATTSTNMASILPRSVKEEHRFIPMSATTSDSAVTTTAGITTVTTTTAPITTEMNIDRPDDMGTRTIFFDTKDSGERENLFKNESADIQPHETILIETNVCESDPDPDITPFVEKFQDTIEASTGINNVIGPLTDVPTPNTTDHLDPIKVTRYESLLQCHMCSEHGFTAAGLKEHLKTHRGAKEYQCPDCSLRFCTNGGLSRHTKVHGGKQVWKCAVCQKILNSKAQLRMHNKSHDISWNSQLTAPATIGAEVPIASVPVTVVETDSSISEKVLLDTVAEKEVIDRNDISEKKEQKEYTNKCKYCPKTFRKPSDLIRHTRTHTGERPYKCDYCNKSFAVKCTLDSHMKVHTGKKPFRCHVCSSLFATKGSLKVHMRLHTGSKPFRCSICDLRFRTSGHRKVHLLKHAREYKPGSPKRKQKHLKVAAVAEAAAHLEKPTKERESEQEQVNRVRNGIEYQSFETIDIDATQGLADQINFNADTTILNNNSILSINESNQLVANLHFLLANGLVTIQTEDTVLPQSTVDVSEPQAAETHVLVASFEPEVSTVHDQSVNGLRTAEIREQLRETEESTNVVRRRSATVKSIPSKKQCDVCGKAFTKPYQLERHKRIHTGERPYKCDLCVKSFAQKSTLQMHQKHHTGDRPYPCPHCEYSFTQKGNLRTHVKRVHQLDTLDIKKLRRVRGHSYAPKSVLPDNLSEQKILSFDDISFVEFLK